MIHRGRLAFFMHIAIRIEDKDKMYILRYTDRGWWLENELGEGMEMSEKNLFDILHHEFKENF
jgi:hypothetical protein